MQVVRRAVRDRDAGVAAASEQAARPSAVSRVSCHFDYQPVASELTFLLGGRCRSLQNEVARFGTDQGVHRSDFPAVLTQSGQVTGGEAGPVLSLLSDELYSLRGDPSPEVYIRDFVFPGCQRNRLLFAANRRREPKTARSPSIMQQRIEYPEFVWQESANYLHCYCKYIILSRMTTSWPTVDGRKARADRTRAAVAAALLALLQDGHLHPTAAEISARAGVSLRSVFQHFEDLESLYAAVSDAQMERLSRFISQETGVGQLSDRTRSFVERRAELLETITPVRRAALLREPFSKELARRLRWAHDMAREEIERTFAPELGRPPRGDAMSLVFALDVATNWSAWDTLRRMNGLSIEESKRVMEGTIRALLNEAESYSTRERRAAPRVDLPNS